MASYTNLKGVSSISEALLSEQLESNLYSWMNWAFLGIGNFQNVRIPTSGVYEGDYHRLRPVDDPNYGSGRVWQAFQSDWVWETGVENVNTQPIRVSGVFVNGIFRPSSGVGNYAHVVNYPLGRVIFNSGIPHSSNVTCEYSHRLYHFTTADVPWFRQIQKDSYRADSQFTQTSSGAWSILGQNRIQLPTVVIDAQPNVKKTAYEIGNLTHTTTQQVYLHVIAETPQDMKFLHDSLTYQQEKRINGYDKNALYASGAFPLNESGSPVGSRMYPDLIKPNANGGFGWRQIRVGKVDSSQMEVPGLYGCVVRWSVEVETP